MLAPKNITIGFVAVLTLLLASGVVAAAVDTLTVTACETTSCTVSNLNTNNTVGTTIADGSTIETVMSTLSASAPSIFSVIVRIRWTENADTTGNNRVNLESNSTNTAYCTEQTDAQAASGDEYHEFDFTSCGLTESQVNDLQVYYMNDDTAKSGTTALTYVQVYVEYSNPPYFTDNLAVNSSSILFGETIRFAANGTDPDTDPYRLTVCDTNAISSGFPGTCTGNTICSSGSTSSGSEASCTNVTNINMVGTNTYYGFLCDSNSVCNTTSTSVEVTINTAAPQITNKSATPNPASSGTTVTAYANVTAPYSALDTVILTILYPNGTTYATPSLTNTSDLYSGTFTATDAALGNYTLQWWANETGGESTTSNDSWSPYMTATDYASITIDGAFGDWSAVTNLEDNMSEVAAFNESAWVNLQANNRPTARYKHGIVFDHNLNTSIMFGGWDGSGNCDNSGINDCNGTYAYNASDNTWYDLNPSNPPQARRDHGMVWDANINKTIIFGGISVGGNCDGSGQVACDGTFAYNATNNTWYDLNPTNPPYARYQHIMVWDGSINKTLMYGGQQNNVGSCEGGSLTYCNGTFAYNGTDNTWYELLPSNTPSRRHSMQAVYDEGLQRTIIFGGRGDTGCDGSDNGDCNGTYAYNSTDNTWYALLPSNPPQGRQESAFTYDFANNRPILTGGYTTSANCTGDGASTENCNGTYTYNYSQNSWSLIETPLMQGRYGHSLNWDYNLSKVLLFGGGNNDGCGELGGYYCELTRALDNFTHEGAEILNISTANDETTLFLNIELVKQKIPDYSYHYRAFIDTNSSGSNSTTPEGNNLPWAYEYVVELNGANCDIYNSSYDDIGDCSVNNSGGEYEINTTLSTLGLSLGDTANITWIVSESDDNTILDANPDLNSFVQYTISGPNEPPTHGTPILNATDNPTNGTSANLTVYNVSTSDADGDPVKNIIDWRLDGTNYTLLNLPFEGGSNNSYTKDYSNKNHTQDFTGATWNATAGRDGGGAYYLYRNHEIGSSDIFLIGNITYSIWFKATNLSTPSTRILSRGSGGADGQPCFSLSQGTSDTVRYWLDGAEREASQDIIENVWMHTAVTYNGSTWTFYVNGSLISTYDGGTLNCALTDATHLGRPNLDGGFQGYVDDVLVYNRSLSAEQIAAIYNERTDLIVSQETSPGDSWQACITPNDGTVDGTEKCSNTLTIAAADSCTYSSGDWVVDFEDNCVISSNVDVYPNSIYIQGASGSFTIESGVVVTAKARYVNPDDFNGDVRFTVEPGGQMSVKP